MFSELDEEIELVERHLRIFRIIRDRGPIGIVKLSEATGHPKHKVRYSLEILEEAGIVEPTHEGATATDDAEPFLRSHGDRLDDLIERLDSLRRTAPEPTVSP
jgi:predicted transcriptional regulator